MTLTMHSQHAFSSDLSAQPIKGASDDGQPRSRSAVPKQPVPHRFQPKLLLAIAWVLALIVLKALPCSAQAEIDPAHSNATPIRNAGNFHGKVTLPFDVKYAGLTLPPGSYSLSVDSLENGSVVTMIPDGKTVKVQAHVRSRSKSHGPDALVLERAGQQRKLAAIRLKEQALTLDLESEPSGSATADTELVLISYASCTSSRN